ncbi:MAG: GTP-binding protein [Eubacterium sp.]|nr:GTP-binding protein [Eubacterium sp.]
MVKVDLITGFLGSGKTTFIRHYAEYLARTGQKYMIIENEFGSISVDPMLLKDLDVPVKDLAGMCMCCAGFDKFRGMLIGGAKSGCDRILVEPSGIYDVDEFFTMMHLDAVRECCEIGSIITIDAPDCADSTDEVDYLMFSQLLAAGTVVVSKTQLFPEEAVSDTVTRLQNILRRRGLEEIPAERIFLKPWDQLSDADFEQMQQNGYHFADHTREELNHQALFKTSMIVVQNAEPDRLKEQIAHLFAAPEIFGNVLRVKGFARCSDKSWLEVNCTPGTMLIQPRSVKRGILVVIGQNLQEEEIRKLFA